MALDSNASVQLQQSIEVELDCGFGFWLLTQIVPGAEGRRSRSSWRQLLVSAIVGFGATLRSHPFLAARAVISGLMAGVVLQTAFGWGPVHLSYVQNLYVTAFLTTGFVPLIVSSLHPKHRAVMVLTYTAFCWLWGCAWTSYYYLDPLSPYTPSLKVFAFAQCGNLSGALLSLIHTWCVAKRQDRLMPFKPR